MKSMITKHMEKLLHEKKDHKRYLAVFLCLAAAVSFGTVMMLKYSGTAMTHKEKVLKCQYKVHEHGEECYIEKEGEKVLDCGYADYAVHVHDDGCYDEEGNLVCPLPEIEEHKHDDSCYTEERVLTCGQPETEGHRHQDSCYSEERGGLICMLEEHQHGAGCYGEDGTMVCMLEEHLHTEECYEHNRVLICGMEENAGGHTHDDSCYEVQKKLTCRKLLLHTHDEHCYDKEGNLICGLIQLESHVHGAACFEIIEAAGNDQEENKEAGKAANKEVAVADKPAANKEVAVADKPAANEEVEAADKPAADEEAGDVDKTDAKETGETEKSADAKTDVITQQVETEKYIVTVEYSGEAKLPEDAKLRVTEYARDSEHFRERCGELGYEPEWLLNVGFFADDKEIEPQAEVKVKVAVKEQMSRSDYDVIHFAETGMETVEAVGSMDEDGNGVSEFVLNTFSDVASAKQAGEEAAKDEGPADLKGVLDDAKIMIDGTEAEPDSDGSIHMNLNP